jgi:hypothetical protein
MATFTGYPTDTYLDRNNADTNYAANTYLQLVVTAGNMNPAFFIDLSSLAGETITSAILYLYQHGWGSGVFTAQLHRVLAANNGMNANSTWNYKTPTTVRYAGDAASDGGTDAGCSISGTDYAAAVVGTLTADGGNAAGTEYAITLDTSEITTLIANNYGLILIPTSTPATEYIYSLEDATPGYHPKLVIVHTSGGGGGSAPRRTLLGVGK